MKLYSYWRSSCSWRVRIALELKQLSYEYIPVHLLKAGGEQKQEEYSALNPLKQVPFLVVPAATSKIPGGNKSPEASFGIGQSLAIIEYLDEAVPTPALIGETKEARARARWLAEIINSGVQPLQNLAVTEHLKELGQDSKPWVQRYMLAGLSALEQHAASRPAPFLNGSSPSLADICLVPQLYSCRRVELPLDSFPHLLSIEARCNELPAFQAAHPDRQPDANS